MSSYIFKLKKDITGRTHLKIKNTNSLVKDDVIYFCSYDEVVKSRWIVSKVKDDVLHIRKEPFTYVNVSFPNVFTRKYSDKVCKLTDKDSESIENYFIHDAKIYPCYDYESADKILNAVLKDIRHEDYDVELYADVYTDNTSANYMKSFRDKYNLIISKHKGIIVFKTIKYKQLENNKFFKEFLDDLGAQDDIYNSLLASSLLTEDGEKLNIPYHRYYVSQNELDDSFYSAMNKSFKERGINSIKMVKLNDFLDIIRDQSGEEIIDGDKHFGIMQMLMPQYVTSRRVDLASNELKFVDSDCYELDENQKAVLESLNERTYIKATAGAGKTIILLAKAYSVAVNNPDKEFLIICYNNKLSEEISILATNTGKLHSNLRIYTLDKFIKDEGISTYTSNDKNDEFNVIKKQFVEAVESGRYNKKYGGIFVDEMQQLHEDWNLALLNCCDENHYMVIAGDYNQQIRPEDASEEADDMLIVEDDVEDNYMLGDYSFKKIILDINYRNTKEISAIINKMIKEINVYRDKLEILAKKDEKTNVFGKAFKNSEIKPMYIPVESKEIEANCILAHVKKLIEEHGYIQQDITLLYPYGSTEYWPWLYKLKQELLNQNLQVCEFSQDSLHRDGIRFSTIGRIIGLESRAIIIFGLDRLVKIRNDNYRFYDLEDLMKQDNERKITFLKHLRNLYVACSRARETLIVIDNNQEENLISNFVKIVGEDNG